MEGWTPYAVEYNPLAAGSIDGTDVEPHDRAIARALNTNFTPSDVDTKPERTIFVGRLPPTISEDKLHEKFSRFGKVDKVSVVRDLVTGQSKGYGFIQFYHKGDASEARRESQHLEIEGNRLIVDREAGHTMKGWIPRRLGGGWGGRKEAGQLRFGCRERPWKRPIVIPQQASSEEIRPHSDRVNERSRTSKHDRSHRSTQEGDRRRSGRRRSREKDRYDDRNERHRRTSSYHDQRYERDEKSSERRDRSSRHSDKRSERSSERSGQYQDYHRYERRDPSS